MIDLRPAAERMADLVEGVGDDRLAAPTPDGIELGALLDHVGTLARVFGDVARKANAQGSPPPPSAERLEPGWRARIAADLASLAEAWRDPAAWEGTTTAGGVDLPGAVAGLVVLDELVVHGWDVAVSSGQPYDPPAEEVEACRAFVAGFDAPRDGRLFGPVVDVPDDAPALDHLLGLAGRDPGWRPPA